MTMIGLGRRLAKDTSDQKYLMPRRRAAGGVSSRYWFTPPAYDQGATSQCVAYSGVRFLVSSPVRNKLLDFHTLYKEAQQVDEWPGENYDGTSVRALFKVFQRRGLVTEYHWAFEVGPVIDHLLLIGPVVMGTVWTGEMANLPANGFLTVDDLRSSQDGHAWCLIGANRKHRNPDGTVGAARAVNSWGLDWGPHKGRFWVSFADLDRLIKADGEACVAMEVNMTKRKTAKKKEKVDKPIKPKIIKVPLPIDGIVRVEAPPGVVPVVIPERNVVEIIPVKQAQRRSWWQTFWGD